MISCFFFFFFLEIVSTVIVIHIYFQVDQIIMAKRAGGPKGKPPGGHQSDDD
jgi:hypothetical protein